MARISPKQTFKDLPHTSRSRRTLAVQMPETACVCVCAHLHQFDTLKTGGGFDPATKLSAKLLRANGDPARTPEMSHEVRCSTFSNENVSKKKKKNRLRAGGGRMRVGRTRGVRFSLFCGGWWRFQFQLKGVDVGQTLPPRKHQGQH